MSTERYDKLLDRFNPAFRNEELSISTEYARLLLGQVRLRDKLISDFRSFLLSWDMSIPEHKDKERWEQARANLLKDAAETLEGN